MLVDMNGLVAIDLTPPKLIIPFQGESFGCVGYVHLLKYLQGLQGEPDGKTYAEVWTGTGFQIRGRGERENRLEARNQVANAIHVRHIQGDGFDEANAMIRHNMPSYAPYKCRWPCALNY